VRRAKISNRRFSQIVPGSVIRSHSCFSKETSVLSAIRVIQAPPLSSNNGTGACKIADYLGDGYALDDGQFYTFDVNTRSYLLYSSYNVKVKGQRLCCEQRV